MDDLISRQAAIDAVKSRKTAEQSSAGIMRNAVVDFCVDIIKKLPPAEPKKRGMNIEQEKMIVESLPSLYPMQKFEKDAIEVVLDALPSAEPKRGRWISADAIFGGVPFYCSECGENTRDTVMGKPRWNFCPNCGAKMEVTE